jgi:hypothetical protein
MASIESRSGSRSTSSLPQLGQQLCSENRKLNITPNEQMLGRNTVSRSPQLAQRQQDL